MTKKAWDLALSAGLPPVSKDPLKPRTRAQERRKLRAAWKLTRRSLKRDGVTRRQVRRLKRG